MITSDPFPVLSRNMLLAARFGRVQAQRIAFLVALLFCVGHFANRASAQIQTPASPTPVSVVAGAPYTQDFNSLAITGTSASLPPGWAFGESGSSEDSTYAAGTGSSATGNTYSFGSVSSSDRAFGVLQSGSLISSVGVVFQNDSGVTITSLTISYIGEEWRLGDGSGRLDRIDFQLSTDATSLFNGTWTDFDDLDFATPNTATTGAKDGNAVENRQTLTYTLSGLNIPSGSVFWVRWLDFNATGSDDGLAIDDFSLEISATTAVNLIRFTALHAENGVLLKWRTGFEVNNLGFNVYREDATKRVQLNPSIIAGSALMTAAGTAMTAGNSYSWFDPDGTAESTYYLEDVDIDGTRTTHVPVAATAAERRHGSLKANAVLLDDLNSRRRNNLGGQKSHRQFASSSSLLSSPITGISSSSSENQRALAAMPALKLSVRETGWYRVTQAAIVAAGFAASVDQRYLHVYQDGVQIPIKINSIKTSGPLRAGDSIEFYGVALDTLTTGKREYWLVSGSLPGKRITTESAKNVKSPHALSESFAHAVELKERFLYFSGLLNGDKSNFFGQVINSTPVDLKVRVQNLYKGQPSRLEVALQGVTRQEHLVNVLINGSQAGSISFSGLEHKAVEFSLSSGVIREGDNTVTLQRMNGEMDISLVDYVRLNYSHTFHADDDYLQFALAGRARVTGFSNARVHVLDITEPTDVRMLTPKIEKDAHGYSFTIQTDQPRTFVALSDHRVRQPAAITFNQPSNWNANVKEADFLIIIHRAFAESVEPLAQLRRKEGMTVAVVDVQDVFDEFSYGAFNPSAIRQFLSWTQTHWERAPRFVLLVGDGSFDPRNHLGHSEIDLMPSPLIDTALLETVSDDWFVDFDDDGVGELSLGRLPARTAAEADRMIARIVNHVPGNAVPKALMVADRMDPNFNFEAASDELATLLPSTFAVQRIYRGTRAAIEVRDEIINGINHGAQVVNFMGHGSVEVWTGESIFSTSDTANLSDAGGSPLVISMTCLNGHYQDPFRESLAESLMRTDSGGAIAVWASSGMTVPASQLAVGRAFFNHLFGSQPVRLGEAIRYAKRETADRDVRRSWVLLGDPTMRIR